MKIQIIQKENYGNIAFYPKCDTAKKLAQLCGTKTLTPYALRIIKDMGYEIEVCDSLADLFE